MKDRGDWVAIEELVTAHGDEIFRGSETYAGYFAASIWESHESNLGFHLLRDVVNIGYNRLQPGLNQADEMIQDRRRQAMS